ncbi:MAG: hypothetical protein ACOYNI_11030, partial [Acidimicrobiia bacterium]
MRALRFIRRSLHVLGATTLVASGTLLGTAALVVSNVQPAGAATTDTYSYTGGAQTWTVPAGVTSITIDAQGAQG